MNALVMWYTNVEVSVMTDNEIIQHILTKDKNAFSILMDKYHNELFSYLYNMTGNLETTEDLLQEVFMKLYKSLKKFDSSKASFRKWMYRITTYHTYNYFKKASTRHIDEAIEVDDSLIQSDEDLYEDIIKDDQVNLILDVMKRVLKPKHQKIMLLHYLSELTVKEISETLNIPDKTIYKAIKTSIEKIKKEVQSDG
jgi:RNA polymerase sigma-70 factor (ECF subfamily)